MRPAPRSWWSCRAAIRSTGTGAAVRTIRTDRLQKEEAPGVSNRKHSQEDGVDQSEDRGIGANRERERQNRHGRKPAIAPEHAERLTQVGAEIVEMMEPPAPAALLFRPFDTAELGPRPALGHFARNTLAHEIVDTRVQMEAQLRLHLCLEPATVEELHGFSGRASRMPATRPEKRFHSVVSALRRFRPAGVIA